MPRVQESPFRETEWDQRLDRMLDDLKSTVTSDSEAEQWEPRRIRSSSRSSRDRETSRTEVEDGGRLKHHHREYNSPDNRSRFVADQYEYDSGDTDKSRNFQKKVMKSTYTNYEVSGGLSSNLESLKKGPDAFEYETAAASSRDTKGPADDDFPEPFQIEVSQPQRISPIHLTLPTDTIKSNDTADYSTLTRLKNDINELDVLICDLDQQKTQSSQSVSIQQSRTSTQQQFSSIQQSQFSEVSQTERSSDLSSIQRSDDPDRESSVELLGLNVDDGVSTKSIETDPTLPPLPDPSDLEIPETDADDRKIVYQASANVTHTPYTNGIISSKMNSNHINEDDLKLDMDEAKSGEVRKIVWRNRFEKTYETKDSSSHPTMTIEEDALHRKESLVDSDLTSTSVPSPPQRSDGKNKKLHLQYAIYSPTSPHISPGGQSWVDPIPLPTPPQVSPRGEPGVAYVYTYGQQGGSQVQQLPPLNYVQLPGATSVPPSEGAPSPTPSNTTQPVVYHYSYHYTIQPGQPLPNGVPSPPSNAPQPGAPVAQPLPVQSPPPALQLAPTKPETTTNSSINYNLYSSTNKSSTTSTTVHRSENNKSSTVHQYHYPGNTDPAPEPCGPGCPVGKDGLGSSSKPCGPDCPGKRNRYGSPSRPCGPGCPVGRDGFGSPSRPCGPDCPGKRERYTSPSRPCGPHCPVSKDEYGHPTRPCGPDCPGKKDYYGSPNRPSDPNSNISITINKTTTHSTNYRPDGTPLTSTPYPNRERSISPDRPLSSERPSRSTLDKDGTLIITRSSHSDSLDRLRKPRHQGLPFPDASPIKPGDNAIPRRVDDLMEDFPDANGYTGPTSNGHFKGRYGGPEDEPLIDMEGRKKVETEIISDNKTPKAEPTKNQQGPPVYYPPGHQLFHETMHTMTLKENKRRGKAKWRMEREAAYKESSSSSETKGGMAMVPVCLPLCCGAACVVM